MIKKLLISPLIFHIILCSLLAQEVLVPLEHNSLKYNQLNKTQTKSLEKTDLPLVLPFVDDFSYPGPYPDLRLWADSFVFVNNSFALHPKTIGTATFDGLNQHGKIYPQAEDTPFQFQADMLTSHPIRLDSVFNPAPIQLAPADSVILSFYFQPQGRGSAPRERDSLVLEFLHTPGYFMEDTLDSENQIWVDDIWMNIWSTTGKSLLELREENEGNYLQRVTINIEDTVYFRKDFKFRFRNYGSFPFSKTPSNFAGNTSIWNLDYVFLDYGRSTADIFYYDIAFVGPAQSMLRNYQAMPWNHFIVKPQQHLKTRFDNSITNLDNQTHNYSYRYFIKDESGEVIRNYSGGTWNIAPFHQQGYQNYEPHSNPIVIPNPLPLTAANAREFRIFHVIREGQGDELQRNDTIFFTQTFDNYFAYDDGIAESGYGLAGFNPKGALRFVLHKEDKLTDVQFYFNPTLHNQNKKSFYLKIWKKLEPEEILYESEILAVDYNPEIAEFVNYKLDAPIAVSDTIYVGWEQITNDFLNIGFDLKNNARENLFYNTHGQWLGSIIDGALMIRPVFGEKALSSSFDLTYQQESLQLYPNPATGGFLHIKNHTDFGQNYEVQVYDASGRLVVHGDNLQTINISSLKNGLYLLKLIPANPGEIHSGKFIITR